MEHLTIVQRGVALQGMPQSKDKPYAIRIVNVAYEPTVSLHYPAPF